MTTGLFLLRAFELHLSMDDLDRLEYGTVLDILTERTNDSCEFDLVATQDDMDKF